MRVKRQVQCFPVKAAVRKGCICHPYCLPCSLNQAALKTALHNKKKLELYQIGGEGGESKGKCMRSKRHRQYLLSDLALMIQ